MAQRQASPCIHWWLLSEPRNGGIDGICRRCGAQRIYPSGLEVPETIPDYEELTTARPALPAETASTEEHASGYGASVSLS